VAALASSGALLARGFGLLIMLAVFNRFDKSYEEAARDLGTVTTAVSFLVIAACLAVFNILRRRRAGRDAGRG